MCMRFFLTILLLAISIIFKAHGDDDCVSDDYFCRFEGIQIDLGYNFGNFISIDRNYTEIDLFTPYRINDWTTFLDASGYRFTRGKWGSSVGVGARKPIMDESFLGTNVFYDYLRGWHTKHNFHRVGVGVEWLNNCWDFHINGYFPVGRKTHSSHLCLFDQLGDGFHATSKKLEYVYTGFDAEVGMPLYRQCDFRLYGAAGPYYFYRRHFKHFWGGYGRLRLDWKSFISFEGRISYDHVYKTNVQGEIQISIPFDFFCSGFCESSCECNCLSTQPIYRNGIILRDDCCNWTWNWSDEN